MHKKSVVLIVLLVFFTSFVLAQNASVTQAPSSSSIISKAYQCLESEISSKEQSSLSLQESIFGILALGSNSKLVSSLDGKIISSNHWQESSNPLKDTAQGLLAYNRIGKNTESIKTWINTKKQPAQDLTWYLEIDVDNHESADCTLSYSNEQQKTIKVNEDMTLSGNPGSCLSISAGGFWLKVSNTCIDYNFTVSCNKDFTTSTLYQRTSSSTVFVSPIAHSTAALGTTTESINSKCLSSSSSSCDYEGTLWAAIALDKAGVSVKEYLPYLLALSESNKRFLPSSFIHILTDGQDQYSELVQAQEQSKFWQAPNTPYSRYYDSALAILSLQGTNSIEQTNSKAYFEGITTPKGCWNNDNIRDTAFLLYAGWSRAVSSGGSSNSSGGSAATCESGGYTCTSLFSCGDLGGEALEDFQCPGTKVCCSKSPVLTSCASQAGVICTSSESCSGTTSQSTEGSCCLGTCNPSQTTNECVSAGGGCYPSCNQNEEQLSQTCTNGNVCCRTLSSTESSSHLGLWITLLVILIALLVAGILMRNKIKMMLFKSRNKTGSSSGPKGLPPPSRPPFAPFRGPIPAPRAQPRIIQPAMQPPIRRPISSSKDKEMEETMAKLKEMSK
jgi:hypothetical protein